MKRFLLLLVLLTRLGSVQSQVHRSNLAFEEIFLGSSNHDALVLGATLNYQYGPHLLSAKVTTLNKLNFNLLNFNEAMGLHRFGSRSEVAEWALMYGPRLNLQRISLSASAGISHSSYTIRYEDKLHMKHKEQTHFTGIPYELNLKFFKKEKRRFRIYCLVPVGKPTAFGHAIGLKLYGNFSGQRYTGLGVSFGLGVHKVYEN